MRESSQYHSGVDESPRQVVDISIPQVFANNHMLLILFQLHALVEAAEASMFVVSTSSTFLSLFTHPLCLLKFAPREGKQDSDSAVALIFVTE